MAGVKISALPGVASALLTDFFPVVQAGVTSQETLSQVSTLFQTIMLPLAGGTMAGAIDMGGFQVTNAADPSTAQALATRNYVDSIATGGGQPCVAATTGALTVTYANGTAGVGATLTNAGAMAAFSLDGVSPTVGQRVLIKDQASTFQNGAYTVTTVGSGAVNWVLTRASDYDTVDNINDTGIIPVTGGTVNAGSGWYNSTKMVTVGTTAITFVRFGVAYPVTLANGGTSKALVAANGGIVYSDADSMEILAATATAGLALLSGSNAAPSWSTLPPFTSIAIQRITATGAFTYTATSGTKFAIFELQGGGSGSAGCVASAGQGSVAAGGGGGGYIKLLVSGAANLAAISGSVGIGGAGGASGLNNGSVGGNTTLVINSGATWTAFGGAISGTQNQTAAATKNGSTAGGTFTAGANGTLIEAQDGGPASIGFIDAAGVSTASFGSNGGSARLAPGTVPSILGEVAVAGQLYGGGASGGANGSGANIAGAAGGQGIVIVTEFISV